MKPLALVVENDAGTRKLLDVLLSRFGFEVDLAPTGSDGLILLRTVDYDAILIDLLLPGASGFEILERLSAEDADIVRRVIVLSSASEKELRRVREQWPATTVIRKPFELGEMIEAAQSAIANRPPRTPDLREMFSRASMRAGAKAGVIVRTDGRDVEQVDAFGYEPGVFESFFPMQLDAPYPLCAAMRHARPVWIASLAAVAPEYPMLMPVWTLHESRALAAVPLMHDGVVFGATGWSFREPRLFNEMEQSTFMSIAASVAAALPHAEHPIQSGSGASA